MVVRSGVSYRESQGCSPTHPGRSTTVQPAASVYPARLEVDYPEQHNRVTTLFRVIFIIPIAIISSVLTAGATQTAYNQSGQAVRTTSGSITAGLFVATLLMIVFRQRYPRWWFDFALELARFSTRVGAYLLLLTDHFVVGVARWWLRVQPYATLMITDLFPPFALT